MKWKAIHRFVSSVVIIVGWLQIIAPAAATAESSDDERKGGFKIQVQVLVARKP